MRITDYIRVANRDLWRQKARSFLTLLALAISAIILVTLTAISAGTRNAINTQLSPDESLQNIIVTASKNSGGGLLGGNVQVANEDSSTLDNNILDVLRKIPHIDAVSARSYVWEFKEFSIEDTEKRLVAQANGIDTDQAHIPLIAGKQLASDASHSIILGYAYAKELGFGDAPSSLIGKKITFTTQNGYRGEGAEIPDRTATKQTLEDFANAPTTIEAEIVGVTASGMIENQVLLPMTWAHQIQTPMYWTSSGLEGEDQIDKNGYSSVLVHVDSAKRVGAVTEAIEAKNYGVVSTKKQIDKLNQFTLIMWVVLGAVSLVSLITACLGIANTMLMNISEQKYAIGVWRATGARKRVIALQYTLQAATLGAFGGILGALVGYFVSSLVNSHIEKLLQAQGLPAVIIANASKELLAATVLITIALAVISGLYPALKAARQDPSKALTSQ